MVKFLDLVKFKEIFEGFYKPPDRMPEMGHYNMVLGILLLLFIGFTRVWHFLYIQFDSVVCGIFNLVKLPYVTTYWRYVDSLGINQGVALLMVMRALRERGRAGPDRKQIDEALAATYDEWEREGTA